MRSTAAGVAVLLAKVLCVPKRRMSRAQNAVKCLSAILTLWTNAPLAVTAGDLTVDNMTIHGKLEVGGGNVPVPTNGLVAYFDFEADTGGNVFDQSGNGNHGQLMGSPTYVASIKGLAPRLTSQSTYVVVPSSNLNLNGWTGITVSVFVKMIGYTTYGMIFERGQVLAGTRNAGLLLNVGGPYGGAWNAGRFMVTTNDDCWAMVSPETFAPGATPYPPLNTWFHLAGTFDGTTMRCYVNGIVEAETVMDPPGPCLWDLPDSSLVIGNSARLNCINWPDAYFNGLIDEVRVYKRALSPSEVDSLYRGVTNAPASSGGGIVVFHEGVQFTKPLGDIPMGTYTNRP